MSNTITLPAEVDTTTAAEITDVVDGAILSAVKETKIATVVAGTAVNTNRAWSFGGSID